MAVLFGYCRRRRRRNASIMFLLGFLVLLLNECIHICANDVRTCAPSSSSNIYEWEDYNYYEILDLASPPSAASRQKRRKERAVISSSDIRRAYRKQAQLYHPDKQKVAKNQTISVEERNARFARIAEAYEVLMNNEKRQEYDEFLIDCEDHLSGTSRSRWSSVFDDLSIDPRRVFEEFFFGTPASEPTWEEDVRYTDERRRGTNSTPIRVRESREVHRDPYSGTEILRILQTEEFQTETEGRLYYRVSGQDFVEQYDRFHGWTYVPVSQPFLVDEGYMQDEVSQSPKSPTNTLSPGEYLLPDSALLTSSSGRYYAGLSSDCEILIMTDAWAEEHVVWSSGTYVPPSHLYSQGGCFLGLRGPHLVLATGTPEQPGTLLWYSDVPESIVEEEEQILIMGGPTSLFLARLDDDGSLAVYRHETSPPGNASEEEESKQWWHKIFMNHSEREPRTRAARAWVRLQQWTRERIIRRQQRSAVFPRETCVYATGPAGCNTPGRKIVHLAYGVGHSMKRTITNIDNAIDTFVESIGEDEDLLDTVFRVANKACNGLLRAVQSLFRIQSRLFHTLYRSMMKRLHSSRKQ